MHADGGDGGWIDGGDGGGLDGPAALGLAAFVAVFLGALFGVRWLTGWQGTWPLLLEVLIALAATFLLGAGGALAVVAIRER